MDDAAGAPIPKIASAPFDDPGADVVLRTGDHVDFRAHRIILKLASPVFRDIFSLPQPQSAIEEEDRGQIPVIPVSEPSDTMDAVLRLCYPVEAPDLDEPNITISFIGSMLAAAQKYDIGAIFGPARKALRVRAEKNEENAFAAYAIACHFKIEQEARFAAVSCLKWRLPGPVFPELTSISGLDYFNLVQFHMNASNVVARLLRSERFYIGTYLRSHACIPCNSDHDGVTSPWWTSFLADLRDVSKLAPLDISKRTLESFANFMENGKCIQCSLCREKNGSLGMGEGSNTRFCNDRNR